MTDLLSAEDIKKAIGAFAGEQRAVLPARPLFSSSILAPHLRGPTTCASSLCHPLLARGRL